MTKSAERFVIARNAFAYRRWKKNGTIPSDNYIIPKSNQPFIGENFSLVEICLDSQYVVVENMGTEILMWAGALSDTILDNLSIMLENEVLNS